MNKRPNIVFITSDQHRGDCFGFEGRKVKTPHLDLMAAEGTRFSLCSVANPMCQPSRASLLTGLLPRSHGVWDNGYDLPAGTGEQGFAGQLSKAGYATGFLGKAHFSTAYTFAKTGTPECRFSETGYGPDWFGPYMGFRHVELCVEGHYWNPPTSPPRGQHYERWYHCDGHGEQKAALQFTNLSPHIVDDGRIWNSALPVAWHNSSWLGDRAIEFVRRHRNTPFCLWTSFPDPHVPFDCPEPWSRLHHPDEVDIPEHRVLDLERRPWWHKEALDLREKSTDPRQDDSVFENHHYSRLAPTSEAHVRRYIANYYGMISLIDHQVGRIQTALDELGIADDTIIAFTSDHGEWLCEHGLLQKGPMLYDGLLRVGLVVKGPGIPGGKVVDDPVSNLDLAATFYDYADISADREIQSQSLRPLIESRGSRQTRDFAYLEWEFDEPRYGMNSGLSLRTVRTRSHKLTLDLRSGAGELYDLRNDPHEMNNLFDRAGANATQRELEDMIRSRQPANDVKLPVLEQVGIN